jgi:hypothetical protein
VALVFAILWFRENDTLSDATLISLTVVYLLISIAFTLWWFLVARRRAVKRETEESGRGV